MMECIVCEGSGEVNCPRCHGEGWLVCLYGCHDEVCSKCDGAGKRSCPECAGDGEIGDQK